MKIIDFANSMSSITRWSQMHSLKDESVLEHTGFVAVYSLYLCYRHDVHPGEALEKAIAHDMEEVITGDIPTTTKYSNPNITKEIHKIEDTAAASTSRVLFMGKMYKPWKEAKDLDTVSGAIVAISDLAAVVCKITQEVSLGNKKFLEFIPRITIAIGELSGIQNCMFDKDIDDLLLQLEEIK